LMVLAAAVVVVGVVGYRRRMATSLAVVALAGPFALILLVSAVTPIFHPRYLFPYSAVVGVLLALGVVALARVGRPLAIGATAALLIGFGGAVGAYHHPDRVPPDDFRALVATLAQRWQPGDVIVLNAGYIYAPVLHYWPMPVAWRGRLAGIEPAALPTDGVVMVQTGTIDGPATLGGGDPRADFYPTTWEETQRGLAQLRARYSRLWMVRGYDTVTDPEGRIREWLATNGQLFEDTLFPGASNIRLQGVLFDARPPGPVIATDHGLLVAGRVADRELRPGDAVPLDLVWQAMEQVTGQLRAVVYLVASDGHVQAQTDSPAVGPQWRSDQWRVGRWVPDPRSVTIPYGAPPGRYQIALGAYFADGRRVSFIRDGMVTPRLNVGSLTVAPNTQQPDPPVGARVDREVAPGLRLVGVNSDWSAKQPGDTARIEIVWRATGPIADLAPVVRLIAADGAILAESVARPAGDGHPTDRWRVGEVMRDTRALLVPARATGRIRAQLVVHGQVVDLGAYVITPRPRQRELPADLTPIGARFGDVAELVGVALRRGEETIQPVLLWRALGETTTAYTVF
ncbi:MAG: hypothetical protein NZ518_07590, partial [Dehalococcoidia bacterium]|nr:hypothetical protein [Dehalococcoidia bacterium]